MMKSDSDWKNQLQQCWSNAGVEEFCETIGVNYSEEFLIPLNENSTASNPYIHHQWTVLENSQISQGVLHVYPDSIADGQVIWEEWFLMDGELHHHILSNTPFPSEESTWMGGPGDIDHPEIVLNIKWHYVNVSDLRPHQFQS